MKKQEMNNAMSLLEAMMWLAELKAAKQQDQEAILHLQAENKIRQEQGRPTVEQELQELVDKGRQM